MTAENLSTTSRNTLTKPALPIPSYTPSAAYRRFIPFGRLALRYFISFCAPRLSMTGRHHIPRHGAVIFAPNHISNSDPPFILHAILRPLWFMAKSELFEMPSIETIIRLLQAFPVEQNGADRAALHFSEQLLQHGQALVVFPEGKCSINGELGPILPGVSLLALRTQVPVIPVGIYGTEQVIPYASVVPRPTLHPVRLHFGAPLHFNDLSELPRREQREAATQRLEQALHQVVAVVQK